MKIARFALAACLLIALCGQVMAANIADMYDDYSSENGYNYWYYSSVQYDAFVWSGGQWRNSLGNDTITRDYYGHRLKMTASRQNGVIMSWHYTDLPKMTAPAWLVATVTPYGTWDDGVVAHFNVNQWDWNGYTCVTLASQDKSILATDGPLTFIMPLNLSTGDAIDFKFWNPGTSGSCSAYCSAYITDVAPPGVPEPSCVMALGSMLGGLAIWRRRRAS